MTEKGDYLLGHQTKSNVVPNDVNNTIVNIKTKHYPFSTSTERMNLA